MTIEDFFDLDVINRYEYVLVFGAGEDAKRLSRVCMQMYKRRVSAFLVSDMVITPKGTLRERPIVELSENIEFMLRQHSIFSIRKLQLDLIPTEIF